MAIPTSPSVVVLENDVSVFAPNIDSSVVGVVGFANKGPVNKATLITSQEDLIRKFGLPDTSLEGQGIEGALEILEATNQLYFVRGIATANVSSYASATAPLGASPSVFVSGYTPATTASSIAYTITDNAGVTTETATVDLVSSVNAKTKPEIFKAAFDPASLGNQNVFAYVEDNGDVFLASKYAGSAATLRVSAAADTDLGFSAVGFNGTVVGAGSYVASNDLTVSGFTARDHNVNIYSRYPGAGYNFSVNNQGATRGLSVELDNVSTRDKLVINSDGAQVESFDALELSPSSADSIETIFTSDENNNKSEYIFVEIEDTSENAYTPKDRFGDQSTALPVSGFGTDNTASAATPRFLRPIEGTYLFANGNSGGTDATDLIGVATTKTGMQALNDDTLNVSIGVIPGITDDEVQNAFITLAETSKNFVAIVAPPFGLSEVQDAVRWINGQDGDVRPAAINSSYAAVYWPWVQVFNPFSRSEQYYDPSIFAARQYVFTDAVSEPWFAPAGFNRGRLTKPSNTEQKLNQGDRDVLYANNINPIANDVTTGITIFGQKTTQRTPTALDRVNVRRLMIYIRKVLLELGKPFQFEPNDQFTWELVEESINPFLDDLLARRAIVEGVVRCDSTTNTPARVDRNELWCSVTIKPTKAAETIVFEVNLTSQSATIN